MMMLKKSPISYIVLLYPKRHLHSKKEEDLKESIRVVPAKYPPKVKSELFSQLYSAREGKIMRTLVREGAWVFIVVGVDQFSLE